VTRNMNMSIEPTVFRPEAEYYGVRGWLLVLCVLMVLVAPAVRGWTIYSDVRIFLSLGADASFEPVLAGNVRSALGIEIFLLLCSGLLSLAAGIALLRKKRSGPGLARVYWASGPVLNILLLLDLWVFLPGKMAHDAMWQTGGNFIGTLIGAAIWITYLNKSKRVKATYARAPGANADAAGTAG